MQSPLTDPSVGVAVTVPSQWSSAVAEPNAASIASLLGLQPKVKVVPDAVITGAVTSTFQLTVLLAEVVLPHASVAVHVLV